MCESSRNWCWSGVDVLLSLCAHVGIYTRPVLLCSLCPPLEEKYVMATITARKLTKQLYVYGILENMGVTVWRNI